MNRSNDLLSKAQPLDRVFFSTGILLDAEDFRAEQTYHRNCLAQALVNLHGSGTAAGLEVEYSVVTNPSDGRQVEQIMVHPGMAVDRMGRLIILPAPACLRLDQWYRAQDAGELTAAFHEPPFHGIVVEDNGISFDGVVVADIFLRFAVCEHGKTPALASGPFDALDAVQPSRLLDSYELSLILRREADLTDVRPDNPWKVIGDGGDVSARLDALRKTILNAWPKKPEDAPILSEYTADQLDKTAVLLSRLAIKANRSTQPDMPPSRPGPLDAKSVTVENDLRAFVYHSQALAHALALV